MNGWKGIAMWAVGALFSAVVLVGMPILAKAVIDNDIRNNAERTAIRQELHECVTDIKSDVSEIKTDIKWLTQYIKDNGRPSRAYSPRPQPAS